MDARERIIQRIFTERHCHHCGLPYESEQVIILARRPEVWMIMVSCVTCEQKDTYVVKFPPQIQGRRRITSYRLTKPPQLQAREIPATPLPVEPVNEDDVLDMSMFLKDFNGDFQQLFAEIE